MLLLIDGHWKQWEVLSVEIDQGMEKYELFINFVRRCITGQYHLWFLFAIVGLYMVTPVLREIAKNVELTKYILVLGFIFALTMPLLGSLPWGGFFTDSVIYINSKLNMPVVMGNTFYFMLGYYLYSTEYSRNKRIIWYVLGVGAALFTVAITSLLSRHLQAATNVFMKYLTPNIAIQSVAIFLLFKQVFNRMHISEKIKDLIVLLSKMSFGMYLVHDFFNLIVVRVGIIDIPISSIIYIPVISIGVFICSFIVIFLMRKSQFLSKYIL